MWFLLLLKQYWKPLLGTTLFISAIIGIYYKGYSDAKEKIRLKEEAAIAHALADYEKARNEIEAKKNIIIDSRTQIPYNDNRDSCILSNDPFEAECTKLQ